MDDPCDLPDISTSPHKKLPNLPLKNCDFSQFFGHNSSLGLHRDLGFVWRTFVTFLIFLYHLTKKLPNQIPRNLLKFDNFTQFFGHYSSLGLDRDLGFSRGHQGHQNVNNRHLKYPIIETLNTQ